MPTYADPEVRPGSRSISAESVRTQEAEVTALEDNRVPVPLKMTKVGDSESLPEAQEVQGSPELTDESTDSARGKIRTFLNALKPEMLTGVTFDQRKQEVDSLLAEKFPADELRQPEVQSKIELLAKGGVSKTTLLGDGLRMQFLDGAAAYKGYLLALHKETGAISYGKDDGTEFLHLLAPLKGLARMRVKEQGEKYKGVVSRIKDVVRTSLMFHNIAEIIAADGKLRSMDQHRILETKDRFGVLDPAIFNQKDGSRQTKKGSVEMERDNLNYRDIIYIVEVDGILQDKAVKMEIQFHAENMHDAKSDKGLAGKFLDESASLIGTHRGVIEAHYQEIGLTAGSLDHYLTSGFTGHDLYKIIRCFDLKEFQEDAAAQAAMEEAKNLSRKIYKSVEVAEG